MSLPKDPYKVLNRSVETVSSYCAGIDANSLAAEFAINQFIVRPNSPENMTVKVGKGAVWNGITRSLIQVAEQTTASFTAPGTDSRFDLIVMNAATGAHMVVAGTAAPSPVDPAVPVGYVPLARVTLVAGQTAITGLDLTDMRVFYLSDNSSAFSVYDCEATAGTSTAYTASHPNVTALYDGLTIRVRWHIASGASPTLNLNGFGAKAIKMGSAGTPPNGLLRLNTAMFLTYQATLNTWNLSAGAQGSAAMYDVGTSGSTVGLLSAANVYSARQTVFVSLENAAVPLTNAGYQQVFRGASAATNNYSGVIAISDSSSSAGAVNAAILSYDDGSSARQGLAFAGGSSAALNVGLRINSDGNVLVGGTVAEGKLTVDGDATIRTGGYLTFRPAANDWDMKMRAEGTSFCIFSGNNLSTPIAKFNTGGSIETGGDVVLPATGKIIAANAPKGWGNFTAGSTPAIVSGVNFASVTRTSTGKFNAVLTTGVSDYTKALARPCAVGDKVAEYADRHANAWMTSNTNVRIVCGVPASTSVYDATNLGFTVYC